MAFSDKAFGGINNTLETLIQQKLAQRTPQYQLAQENLRQAQTDRIRRELFIRDVQKAKDPEEMVRLGLMYGITDPTQSVDALVKLESKNAALKAFSEGNFDLAALLGYKAPIATAAGEEKVKQQEQYKEGGFRDLYEQRREKFDLEKQREYIAGQKQVANIKTDENKNASYQLSRIDRAIVDRQKEYNDLLLNRSYRYNKTLQKRGKEIKAEIKANMVSANNYRKQLGLEELPIPEDKSEMAGPPAPTGSQASPQGTVVPQGSTGSPAVITTPDGKKWRKNPDGSVTEIL